MMEKETCSILILFVIIVLFLLMLLFRAIRCLLESVQSFIGLKSKCDAQKIK